MTTAAERLAGLGVTIDTEAGTLLVRYDFAALMRVEDEFGTLAAAGESLNALWRSVSSDYSAPVLAELVRHLAAVLGRPAAEVAEILGPNHPTAVITALAVAWRRAWPEADEEAAGSGKARGRSRGSGSTGGRQSGSVAPTGSSGG